MFTGVIEGVGPRYCPSIEDKIHRFADKGSHQIFPRTRRPDTHEIYPNGISTSLPFDVQLAARALDQGLENAHILRPGYAIEYDYFDPRAPEVHRWKPKSIGGLFFAGQINGTTGYEEAGGAGAARRRQRRAARARRSRLVPAPRRGVPRRAGRRPHHPRRVRAVSHVHQPRRVPPDAARGQRRPAADRNRPRAGPGRRRALGRVLRASASASARSSSGCDRPGSARVREPARCDSRVLGQPLEREYTLARSAAPSGRRLCCV